MGSPPPKKIKQTLVKGMYLNLISVRQIEHFGTYRSCCSQALVDTQLLHAAFSASSLVDTVHTKSCCIQAAGLYMAVAHSICIESPIFFVRHWNSLLNMADICVNYFGNISSQIFFLYTYMMEKEKSVLTPWLTAGKSCPHHGSGLARLQAMTI